MATTHIFTLQESSCLDHWIDVQALGVAIFMVKRLILKAMKRNGWRSVNISDQISLGYLFWELLGAVIAVLRGVLTTRRVICVHKNAKVKCVSLFAAGRGCVIKHGTVLDCWGASGISLGSRVSIGALSLYRVSGSLAHAGTGIQIGDNVGIGDFAHIGGAGGVVIGDNTITGAYLSIHPENHNFNALDTPIRLQGVSHKGVVIGADCWLGAKVTILDGSTLGPGCVVAAGAVVRGQFPPNAVIGGVPAKVLGVRGA